MSSDGFDLVAALLDLHANRGSAMLRLEKDGVKKQLAVRGGSVAFAESNVAEEHLARVLVDLGRISRADLTGVAALMKSGKPSDEALLGSGKVDAAALAEGVRAQAVKILASLLPWNDSEASVLSGDRALHRATDVQIPIPELLVLAARRAVQGRRLPTGILPLKGSISRSADARRSQLEAVLDASEATVFVAAESPMDAQLLLSRLARVEAKAEEAACRLLLLGLIEIRSAPPAVAGAPQPSEDNASETRLERRIDEMLQRFEVASHYEILSIAHDATTDQIQAAYHELAKEFHPDHFPAEQFSPEIRAHVEKLFTSINGAYTVLSEPTARANYDASRLAQSEVEAAHRARVGGAAENEKIAEALFSAGRISMGKRDYEKAVAHLKECVWLRPADARYRLYLGVAESQIPKYRKEAEEHLLKAIELDRMGIDSYLALGKLYMKVNLPRRAEVQFAEVLRWDPNHAEALRLIESVANERERAGKFKRR
jgi:tetratricopeptide (TPR) repeat protein